MLGEEVLAGISLRHREPLRALAHEHDMARALHNGLGHQRNILDIAHAADGTGAARGPVHATGIQFDDAFFVGQAAETDAVVVGIVFWPADYEHGGIESVAPLAEDFEALVDVVETIAGGDDDWARNTLRCARGRCILLLLLRLQTQTDRAQSGCAEEITTRKSHCSSKKCLQKSSTKNSRIAHAPVLWHSRCTPAILVVAHEKRSSCIQPNADGSLPSHTTLELPLLFSP